MRIPTRRQVSLIEEMMGERIDGVNVKNKISALRNVLPHPYDSFCEVFYVDFVVEAVRQAGRKVGLSPEVEVGQILDVIFYSA